MGALRAHFSGHPLHRTRCNLELGRNLSDAAHPLLRQPPTFIAHGVEMQVRPVPTPQSRWARFFLTQPAPSMGKRIFDGLFYFFFGVGVIGGMLGLLFCFPNRPAKILLQPSQAC
jgi:hypothetical protein